MPSGIGIWLEPRLGEVFEVTTHNAWLLDGANQERIDLEQHFKRALSRLDRVGQIDEIRMIGVIHGLVRLRDYENRVAIQFYCEPARLPAILNASIKAVASITSDPNPLLTVQNLKDDQVIRIELEELAERLEQNLDLPMILPGPEAREYNEALRQRVHELLNSCQSDSNSA